MNTKRRGLGRNLEALLGPGAARAPGPAPSAAPATGEAPRLLPVALLQPGKYQPRRDMHEESLDDLAASIKAQGVIQPVIVRPLSATEGKGRYEIIAGERRWRAAQKAGLDEVPVVVRQVADRAAIAMALIENIQREDLNPIEEAGALQRLIAEFELTHDEAAQAVGRSRAAVSNLLRLLDLAAETRKLLEAGKLEMGQARALLGLAGLQQVQTAQSVVAKGLSTRETEALVKRLQAEAGKPPARAVPAKDANVRRLEAELAERLGAKVSIEHRKDGHGTLTVAYASLDELDGILDKLRR
jgi:ParB family chromosome partitioning protein